MPEWAAEVIVREELARRLVDEQFPQLEARRIRLLAEGWDNSVWVVDEMWAFRFPRRQVAVALLELELTVLPRLAPLLPVAIPTPVLHGHSSEPYPWPFFASRLLPGKELGSAALSEEAELRLADSLGHFLRTLHSPDVTAAMAALRPLPEDPNRRADMSVRVPALNGFYAGGFDHDEVREAEFVMGACMLARRSAIDQVGLLDEDYFLFSEETDWCYRFRRAGWQVLFFPGAECVHVGGASHGGRMYQENLRGHLLFLEKHRGPKEAERGRRLLLAALRLRSRLFRGERGRTYREAADWLASGDVSELLHG